MPPREDRAIVDVLSTHVRSADNNSILVEPGGHTPARWFLNRARILNSSDGKPPRKRRKIEAAAEDVKVESDGHWDREIPLFEVGVDFCFNDRLIEEPTSKRVVADDAESVDGAKASVILSGVDSDGTSSTLRVTLAHADAPVLVLDCTSITDQVIDILRLLIPARSVRHTVANARAKQRPASIVSCTLTASGSKVTVLRLQASVRWRSGVSAFPAGVPVGTAKVYPDYDTLLAAFPNHTRDQFDHSQPWTPQDFYDSVYVPPKEFETDNVVGKVLESDLFPFQKRAVAWMLSREDALTVKRPSRLEAPSFSLYAPVQDLRGKGCFVNHLEGIVSRTLPPETAQPSGGLLAEEMGLGKTVELMALISLHPRPPMSFSKVHDEPSGTSITTSRATLIITPLSILQQWQHELRQHAPKLKVHHYQGIPSGNKQVPSEQSIIQDLATAYDVVLATYHTLAREIHFAQDPPDRERRHARKFARKSSPLVQLQWWRICLDEAQMVESGVTAAARVACRLPRIHSWAVSGTPLRKNAQDLHGLLIFLRHRPFSDDARLWSHLVTNHRHLFRQIFRKLALRHTKSLVRAELRLPPQKRVVVTVPFSVVEQQNYATLFQQMCDDVGVRADGSPKFQDWDPEDPATLERMRSWLVRLRQTCLHPQIGGKNRRALGRGPGPLRTVAEVLEVMIEQNEGNVRAEERTLVLASLLRGHVLGNDGSDERRSENALAIYEEIMRATEESVLQARDQLVAAKKSQAESGEATDNTDDESSESARNVGRWRNNLRTVLELHHTCTFFAATAYFQIKTNKAQTAPDSDRFKELDEHEADLYEKAKLLRKEILQDAAQKAEVLMRRIRELEGKGATRMPKIKDLTPGGIESRRITETSNALFDVIRQQVGVIQEWRAKMAELLLKSLVDEDIAGLETTGDEYEDSTKSQDELYVYFDAIKAMQADLNTFVTGTPAPLIDHEVNTLVRAARWFLDPEVPEDQKPVVHAPQLALKLFATRNKLRARREEVGSVRKLLQEARNIESSTQWREGSAPHALAKQHLTSLQSVFADYTKALEGLESEVDLFRRTQNQRVEFYRQLQELSDGVAPYKEELDEELDRDALASAMADEEHAAATLAQLRTKARFLVHLRGENGPQAEPKICIICTATFELGVLTVCGHQFCKTCIGYWFKQARSCPMCKRRLTSNDMHDITFQPRQLRAQEEVQADANAPASSSGSDASPTSARFSLYSDVDSEMMDTIKSIYLPSSYGTKIDTLARHLLWLRDHDPSAKSIVFSQYREFLDVLGGALREFGLQHARLGRSGAAKRFCHEPAIACLLLDARTDSSGLTLVHATHVFVCEPLVQTAVELQAVARVHRIGQTRPTTVWMYLVTDSVEEAIYDLSVARRLAHVHDHSRQVEAAAASSSAAPLQDNAIEAADSEELQSAPLTQLLAAGKGAGELVGNGDLWQCLFWEGAAGSCSRHARGRRARSRETSASRSSGAESSRKLSRVVELTLARRARLSLVARAAHRSHDNTSTGAVAFRHGPY